MIFKVNNFILFLIFVFFRLEIFIFTPSNYLDNFCEVFQKRKESSRFEEKEKKVKKNNGSQEISVL